MQRKGKQTRFINSLLARSLAIYRHTFRHARAMRFWRAGGVPLMAAAMMGLTIELASPPTPALAIQLSGTLELANVGSTVSGARFVGVYHNDQSGYSLSGAGDVNADGWDDLIIGAPLAGDQDLGQSYLIYGRPSSDPISGTCLLEELSPGYNNSVCDLEGAFFTGIGIGDRSGWSVSGAGDVNGDGQADLIIGAVDANVNTYSNRGQTYLIYGQPSSDPISGGHSLLQLAYDNSEYVDGAIFHGIANWDHSGYSVSDAGDVNGDGLDDLIIGAHTANPGGRSNAGQSYLVYGRPDSNPLSGELELANVGGTVAGATFNGIDRLSRSGGSVSSAGDVNGDGLDDFLIGAKKADVAELSDDRGQTFLIYGQPDSNPLTGELELANVGGAVAGATFNGIAKYDYSGVSVSSAGDVNGDGLDDLIIGAYSAPHSESSERGQSYLIYGQRDSDTLSGTINLALLENGLPETLKGVVFNGIEDWDSAGWAVSGAGDVNGDGLDDLLIGARFADVAYDWDYRGETYLIYGQPDSNPLPDEVNLANVGADGEDAVAGVRFNGIADYDYSGRPVSGAGDINGDGLDDILIGAFRANNRTDTYAVNYGESYLIYGQRSTQCRWTGPASGDWDNSSNWSCPGGPSPGDEVFIQPVNELTVSGSSSTKTIDSLDIGTQYAGTATLAIAPSGSLHITGTLTLEADGKLSGDNVLGNEGNITADHAIMRFNGEPANFNCTGTLISETFVLTAAHCASSPNDQPLGNTEGRFEVGGQVYTTSKVYVHENYDPKLERTVDDVRNGIPGNDIALYELSQSVTGITPSPIFTGTPQVGEELTLVGFGYGGDGNTGHDGVYGTKRKGTTPIDEVTSTEFLWYFDDNTESNMAPGDSGGPAFLLVDGVYQVAGVTSVGYKPNAAIGDDSVDTRVDFYENWIAGKINPDEVPDGSGPRISVPRIINGTPIDSSVFPSVGKVGYYFTPYNGPDGTVTADGGIINQGEIDLGNHGLQLDGGTLTNTGLIQGGGTINNFLVNTTDGIMNFSFGTSVIYGNVINDGTVTVMAGSTVVYKGNVTGSGSFLGDGTHSFENDLATEPVASMLNFGGNVTFGAGARLESDLAGTDVGWHDQLDIAGSAILDGTLDLVPLTPYTDPTPHGTSDKFVMITAAARSGTFNTVQYDGLPLAPDFGPDASGSFRDHVAGGLFRNISYTATTVELQNLRALQGDTDGDQDVDLSDYTRLATNFAPGGSGLTWTDGDFDFDGDIDLSDYNRLTGNFNPGGYTTLAGVPEPTSLVLIVAGLLVLVGASPGPHRNR